MKTLENALPLKLYLRKENDALVVAYRNPEATSIACGYSLENQTRLPDRRNKWVWFNCYKYNAVWLPNLKN